MAGTTKAASLSDRMIDLIAARFRALSEPQRIRIVQLLESGEKSVSELVEHVGGSQPNVSRHLQTLYEARLVGRRRQGNSVFYSISDPMVHKLCEVVCRSAEQELRNDLAGIAGRTGARTRR